MSLPMRERGLKYLLTVRDRRQLMSLPMRERGLKCQLNRHCNDAIVAPHAGAWIEISADVRHMNSSATSLPMRERGLKFSIERPC